MSTPDQAPAQPYGDYKWPTDLYEEMYQNGILSFLVYTFGYVLDCARKNPEEFKGLSVDDESQQITKSQISGEDRVLQRSFSAKEIKSMIETNIGLLSKANGEFRGKTLANLYKWLDIFITQSEESGLERPFTIEEYDDKFQTGEAVYGVFKDCVNKRIIVVFRGSDELAFFSNWMANVYITKTEGIVPDVLKDELGDDKLYIHNGFYNYLFNKTKDTNDEASTTKFDQVLADVKALLAQNEGYKVYCCGHSLGAALSTIAAFYLSCDPDIPKPVSNVSFASPRVGSETYFKATQILEKRAQLRVLRSVNENDTVTVVPSIGYEHVGFQVTAYKKRWYRSSASDPDIHYPNQNDGFFSKLGTKMGNSLPSSLNLGYDHADYLERIVLAKDFLQKQSLNSLYMDEDMVGYKVEKP